MLLFQGLVEIYISKAYQRYQHIRFCLS